MSIIDDALAANVVAAGDYDASRSGPPKPRIAIVTCADPRLSGITKLLGLDDADVDMIRNVGTVVDDDTIRSLVVSTRGLGTTEIMIINHDGCGMTTFTDAELTARLRTETGAWPIAPANFFSFTDPVQNTREQMAKVRSHPWIAGDVPVRGFVFDVGTGRLHEVPPIDAAGAGSEHDG